MVAPAEKAHVHLLLLQLEVGREQTQPLCLRSPPPSQGHHWWRKSARGQRLKAWVTNRLRLMKKRLETAATEGQGGTVLQGRAATVRSLEMAEWDQGEAWMWRCQESVVQGGGESGKATKMTEQTLKEESVVWAEML